MINSLLASKEKCTGCGLCATVCPTKSIKIVQDREGFYYPEIENSCINCGKCSRACPILNEPVIENRITQKVCMAIHKDKKIWEKSTSGGAFTAICNLFGDSETIVFGAKFDANNKSVCHAFVEGVENIDAFRGSKYSQSLIGDSFVFAKEFLEKGRKVIFSGTPCQISALRNYLGGKSYKNLLCIDLICHGVGSPKVLKEYLEECEINEKAILDYEFRHKIIKLGRHSLYNSKFIYKDGGQKIAKNDLYNNLFLQKIICRKSCDSCEYANLQRQGDLTVGDAKQAYSINLKVPSDRNGSVIICNTENGVKVFERLSECMDIYSCTINDVVKANHPLSHCTPSSKKREEFFASLSEGTNVITCMNKYFKKSSVSSKISKLMPDKFKARIKKIIKKEE